MSKVFGILCLGVVGLLYSIVIIIAWIIGLIYLVVDEIIGTRRFMKKFSGLNKIIKNEFIETLQSFRRIFE